MATAVSYRDPKSGQVVTAADEKQGKILEAGGYVRATAAEVKAAQAQAQPERVVPSQPTIELPKSSAQGRLQAEERELREREAQAAQELEALRNEAAMQTQGELESKPAPATKATDTTAGKGKHK